MTDKEKLFNVISKYCKHLEYVHKYDGTGGMREKCGYKYIGDCKCSECPCIEEIFNLLPKGGGKK